MPHKLRVTINDGDHFYLNDLDRDFENGDGLCLTLYIISSLVCATDLPFNYYGIATDAKKPRRLINFRDANRNALRISQIRELDFCIFPLLAFLQNTVAILKARYSI
jgi:hypothetical protein